MNSSHGRFLTPRYKFMVYTSRSEFLKKWFTKPLGPSLGVNRMWTKRNDHAARSGWAYSFNISPKCVHLSSLLVKCVEDVSCKSSHNNSTKNERFNLYMFNVIYVWHVPCVVTTLNRIFCLWLNLMLLLHYLAQQYSSIL